MKVLITGGAGYLGSNLTRHLLEAGYTVTVLDNLMYDQVTLLHLFGNPKFQFELGDVRDKKLLQELVGLNDVIIPLAAIVGMPACKANPELTVAVNYYYMKHLFLVKKCLEQKIWVIIIASQLIIVI